MQIERGRLLADIVSARKTIVGTSRICESLWQAYRHRESWVADNNLDSPASSEPGDRENGEFNNQHATRFSHRQNHSFPYILIPSRYICFGEVTSWLIQAVQLSKL
jgi:hypothetical protein